MAYDVDGFSGLLVLDIRIPGSRSLKDKRQHLQSIKTHIKNAGMSVSEVSFHENWNRSQIAISAVTRTSGEMEKRLDDAIRMAERTGCEATTIQRAIMSFSEVPDDSTW